MQIAYISWNYGTAPFGEPLHLIRLTNGHGLLRTTIQMRKLGLCQ